jgi:hypothetical protein
MDWQDIAVFFIVAGAVWFLFRRVLLSRRARSKPAQSFVPLSSLKKRPPQGGCH